MGNKPEIIPLKILPRIRLNIIWLKDHWESPGNLTLEASGIWLQNYTVLGKQTLGTNETLCSPGPRRKEQWPHKRLTLTCLWVLSSLWQRRGWEWPATGWGALRARNACTEPFEGGRHYLHYLHHSLVSGQTTGREHSPAHQQKIGLKIYFNLWEECLSFKYTVEGLLNHQPIKRIYFKASILKLAHTLNLNHM